MPSSYLCLDPPSGLPSLEIQTAQFRGQTLTRTITEVKEIPSPAALQSHPLVNLIYSIMKDVQNVFRKERQQLDHQLSIDRPIYAGRAPFATAIGKESTTENRLGQLYRASGISYDPDAVKN